jgi:hypothetical protein
MTAVTLSRPARVLRIEIRRSVVPWAIPLLAALFFFDSYRTAAGFPPVWTVRASVITNHMLLDFCPFAAGLGAWVGSREGRRNAADLLATTVRPAWARQASALGATAVVAVTTHSPFGEPERATGRWLPCLRLGTALALTGAAIGLLQLAVTGASLNGGVLVLARNVIGITGIGLLASVVTGGLLAWIPPMAYAALAEYALLEAWRSPWTWPVRPPDDRGAWIGAAVVFAAGLAAFTVRGARASLADTG